MSTPEPTITIELGCRSVVEHCNLAPHFTSPHGFMATLARTIDKQAMRRFQVKVADYPLDRAKVELDLEVERYKDRMVQSEALANRMKTLVETGDRTEDIFEIARLIQEARDCGSSPFIR